MAYVQNIGTIILRFGIPEADIVTNTNNTPNIIQCKKSCMFSGGARINEHIHILYS